MRENLANFPPSLSGAKARMRQPDRIPGQMAASSIDAFLAFREEMDVCWDEPPLSRLRQMMPPTPPTAAADAPRFSWDDIDDGPAEDDPSWAAFDEAAEARDGANGSGPSSSRPDRRRLTKAQREKRDKEEQMAESRGVFFSHCTHSSHMSQPILPTSQRHHLLWRYRVDPQTWME